MSVKWTNEQRKVIEARDCDLLVSAAAGSGKTAVLIERIVQRILDPVAPINVDEILVVTFTRAAAAEMSTRIAERLTEMLAVETKKDPESDLVKRLSDQYQALARAQISTIDSFAKRVVMEHYEEADIDPGVRIADENELKLLKADVMEELLEEKYNEGDKDFLDFAEYFARGKEDGNIETVIESLVRYSESFADPEGWLYERRDEYLGDMEKLPSIKILHEISSSVLKSISENAEYAMYIAESPMGPVQYMPVLIDEADTFRKMSELKDIDSMQKAVAEYKFARLPGGKAKEVDEVCEDKKETVKSLRNDYKKSFQELLQKKFLAVPIKEAVKDFNLTKASVNVACNLAIEFSELYKEAKKKKNLVDFSDLEHLALRILRDKDGNITEAAKEYREEFKEVMTDEYQDSNLMQELILTAVAGSDEGRHDFFMVGDVKQSIYSFRQARPELFIGKYGKYKYSGEERKIDLHNNFRSRKEVLDPVNDVFDDIMHADFGNIEYDEAARLVPGGNFEDDKRDHKTEFILSDRSIEPDDEELASELARIPAAEYEGHMLALRIRELHDKEGYKYKDITILFRTMKGWAEPVKEVLMSQGIPAVSETTAGYFSAWEVEVALSLLSVIDNPRQDIPLAAVMLSPVGKFSPDELASLRIMDKSDKDLWELVLESSDEKVVKFRDLLVEMRRLSTFLPVHELIIRVLDETNFTDYVAAMPGGAVRERNLAMLVARAEGVEASGIRGLVHFNRYIKKIKDQGIDFGEADALDTLDAVRIMSIHKSKGLQFPVVFVSGLGKTINKTAARESVIIHPRYGIGVDCFNLESRERWKSLPKIVIAEKADEDTVAEEERLLYVAMTRAIDKLILTGQGKKITEKLPAIAESHANYLSLAQTGKVMDLVLPTVLRKSNHFNLIKLTPEALIKSETKQELTRKKTIDKENSGENEEAGENASLLRKLTAEMEYNYPYERAVNEKVKYTVSEIKRLGLTEEEAGEVQFFKDADEEKEAYVPEFARNEEAFNGADRGTLYHSVMRHIDLSGDISKAGIETYLDGLKSNGKISKGEREALVASDFANFLQTDLAKRMIAADKEGFLFREAPFVMNDDTRRAEPVLVQGIIDAWFEDKEGIILLDYKTDRVSRKNGERILTDRYKLQLDLYAEALKKATGKDIAHKYIYSFTLGKVIECD